MALELGAFLLVLCIPALGVWAASSLAAYWNAPRELALGIGALVFPVLPLVWELAGEVRWRRRGASGPRILTFGDRLTLRTLALSLTFLVPMLLLWPAPLFMALTTRGDWFLDGAEAAWAPGARRVVLGTADALVWLYDQDHDNPWREGGSGPVRREGNGSGSLPTERSVDVARAEGDEAEDAGAAVGTVAGAAGTPSPSEPSGSSNPPSGTGTPTATGTASNETGAGEGAARPSSPRSTRIVPGSWPYPDTLHPLAHAAPEAEASIEALGDWYEAALDDPTERAKAIHDWIADHVAYDVASYRSGTYPPQDAQTTFTTRLSVCAGYANLFTAMGRAAGLTVETVVGDARTGAGEPEGHAWNAIELDGAWYLVDATWDAGFVNGDTFTRRYRAAHFLLPPEVMGVTHFPDDPRWQLRDPPLSRGEWNRQPILRPEFFVAGLRLLAPDRALVETGRTVSARVESSGRTFLLASAEPTAGGERTECTVTGNATFDVRCELPRPGTYRVILFSSPVRYGTYGSVASFEAAYR